MKTWNRRTAVIVMMLLITTVLFSSCSGKEEETNIRLTRVETSTAAIGTLEITGSYIGTVAPHNSVNVTPLVSGVVKTVNVKVGDHVKSGDVLCQFDDTAADLQVQSAKNAVDSAKAGKEAAEDQIDAAKKQAEASVTSMEGQIKTLRAQKKSAEDQLEQLEEGLPELQKAMNAASEAYTAAKNLYDSANTLYIQYQAFLSANPDCATTAGLTNASILVPLAPDNSASGSTAPAETATADQAAVEKQQTAALLLKALGEIPLTVEYLTEAGLKTLKDQADQAKDASTQASSAYSGAASSVAQLESTIKQLNAQIKALEDNIDATEDAADAAGGTQAYDAQIKAAQTGVDSAQYQKDLYTVTAPIDGIVESVNVTENEISAQGYPAFTISDKEAMEVSFYVPEDVRDYLKVGDKIQVETASGSVNGSVSLIGTAVDAQKGLFKIEAQITTVTDKSLLSNTSVSLTLVTNSVKNQILIPFDAVYYDNDQAYVFVVEKGAESDRAIRRNVTAGAYNNDTIAILEGLSEGEQVITTWGAGLKDGAPIEVIRSQTGDQTGAGTQQDTQTP